MLNVPIESVSLSEKKRRVANSFLGAKPRATEFSLKCFYHGVAVQFYFESSALLLKLKNFLPTTWLAENFRDEIVTRIFWLDPKTFFSNAEWESEARPDCDITQLPAAEVAFQRDFIGIDNRENSVVIIAHQALDDGFFNALRWLIPRKMIEFERVLLHSSCVVGKNDLAYFFLGASGAGKTTVTELSKSRTVLGDDMNVLDFSGGKLSAEAGALGQRYFSSALFAKQFPVGGFFWLKQSERNFLKRLDRAKSSMCLLSSCANLFWSDSSADLAPAVMQAVDKISASHPVYELEFNLTGGFWDHVENAIELN